MPRNVNTEMAKAVRRAIRFIVHVLSTSGSTLIAFLLVRRRIVAQSLVREVRADDDAMDGTLPFNMVDGGFPSL
jgi:hypothetical protein